MDIHALKVHDVSVIGLEMRQDMPAETVPSDVCRGQ